MLFKTSDISIFVDEICPKAGDFQLSSVEFSIAVRNMDYWFTIYGTLSSQNLFPFPKILKAVVYLPYWRVPLLTYSQIK